MAVKFGLWRVDGKSVQPVAPSDISSEERLEDILVERLDMLGLGKLLRIGRQVRTDFDKYIDLLAMDEGGDLYVIELKKGKTPREVVAQVLEYGFWVKDLSFVRIGELFAEHHDGEDFESSFNDRFETEVPEAVNNSHRLVVVATGMDRSTEQIIEYVRDYEVPINVLFFEYLDDDGREYVARSWLVDPEFEAPNRSGAKKQPAWNGTDFYVAVGDGKERNWDDMRRYGFVSAGHGTKYRNAMQKLPVGARVWAAIPSSWANGGAHGYVGVGRVTAEAIRVGEFDVEVEGRPINILDAPLKADNMAWEVDDPERCEYLVGVDWIEKRPREEAFWEKGMFANQNVVAKLRHQPTLKLLEEKFATD